MSNVTMKRRGFLHSFAAAGAATLFGSTTVWSRPLKLLETREGAFRVGQTYRSVCGGSIELVAIDQQKMQGPCQQYRLRFEGQACGTLEEGVHALQGPNGRISLFLQPAADGARVAWFNHFA